MFQVVPGNGFGGDSGFGSGAGFGGPSRGASRPGNAQTIVTKDIYVHVPPPEGPEEFEGETGRPSVNKKHYKILFIKAPTPNFQQQLQLMKKSQGEEKTLVYVLVKKPDIQTALDIEETEVKPQNKPEVYFIKYKTRKESQSHGHGHGGHDSHAPTSQYGPPGHQAGGPYQKK